MMIRKYRDIPATYAPDVNELIMARRSVVDGYTKARVVLVRRTRAGRIKIRLQWMEDNPGTRTPIVKDTPGWVEVSNEWWPPLIQQISKSQP